MLTQYLGLGGLERMILNLATSLKSEFQWQPQVFVFDHSKYTDPSANLGSSFEAVGIPVVFFSKGKGFSFQAVLKIARIVLEQDVSVIHSHDLGALIYGACAKVASLGRVRLVHTQHSFVHLARKKRYQLYEKFFTFFADEVTVVSPDTLDTYRKLGLSERRIHFVPNGVRFAVGSGGNRLTLAQRGEARRAAVESLGGQPTVPALQTLLGAHWVLYMARVHGRKGQDHAMKLWSALEPSVRRKATLLFVGLETEPGQLDKLNKAIEAAPDRDRVLYLGPTHQPGLWLQASEVFLSSSEFEGMPLASIEAAGSGLALVLSAIPGHESLKSNSLQYPLEHPEQGAGSSSE